MPYFPSELVGFLIERPLILLALASLPFIALVYWRNVFPSARFAALMLVPAVAALAQIVVPASYWYIGLIDLLIVVVVIVDFLSIPAAQRFRVSRSMDRIASLRKWQLVEVTVSYAGRRKCAIEIVDDLPQEFVAEPSSFATTLQPNSRAYFEYRTRAESRGLFQLRCLHLLVQSRWRLWRGFYQLALPGEVHVYPDLKQISEFELLARTNRLNLLGMRKSRKVGRDNEFERLRDYSLDDNYRHIDWRATARRQKLTVRDFQANQNQQVIFMIDCGRMMTAKSNELSLLDFGLNAMLMLSYVALRQADSVGLCLFSERVHQYVAPKSGVKQINRLLHASFNEHPRFVESRYDSAFIYLQQHCRKRSLVILVTNVADEINASQIRQYLANSTGRHLTLGVLLRDHTLFEPLMQYQAASRSARINEFDLFRTSAACDIIHWRQQVLTSLNQSGVLTLDVFPEQLTAQLVNRYLEIKARHLL